MNNYQRGQILLIVVLVMTIALTIGLSVATRTITNIRTSTEEESSQRAFSAAEAGMEKALQESAGGSGSLTNNSSYQTSITPLSGVEFVLNNGAPILKDATADVWLSIYPAYSSPWTGNITFYWGSSADVPNADEEINTLAALEIVLISGTKAQPTVAHYSLDPWAPRASQNGFDTVAAGGGTVGGKAFAYKTTIPVTSGLLMRVIPLYASSLVAVKGCDAVGNNCNALPAQGTLVTSVGTSSNTQTKIVAFKENPRLPIQIFPFIIFSPK